MTNDTSTTPPAAGVDSSHRTRWFHEARFGIFIHWGVYAVPAGEYQGQPVGWIGEWIMHSAKIPVAEYRAFAKDFTAINYQPEEWADLAKEAGARYLIITAKHHEGFALYDSPTSEWNSVRSSAAGKDLLAPLEKAVRARGMKFGLYYSQAQDWVHPGGGSYNRDTVWDPAQTGNFDEYLQKIALPQSRELIELFSPDILWWDTPVSMTTDRAKPFADLLAAHPNIITNDRLGGDFPGDTKTPEQHIPPRGYPGEMFEVCMTMNDTWGYKKDDHNWKSSREIIQMLSDIASKGGNFLLNIGPDPTGLIPEASIRVLKDLGRWMNVNAVAIYETEAGPFVRRLPWGRVTRKDNPDDTTTLYLHVWDWKPDQSILLPTLQTVPTSATVLATGTTVTFKSTADGIVVQLPGGAPDPDVSIIRLELPSAPVVAQAAYSDPSDSGAFLLRASDADTHGGLAGNITLEGQGDDAILARWHNIDFRVEYVLKTPSAARWRVQAEINAAQPIKMRVKCGDQEFTAGIPATEFPFQNLLLGDILLPEGVCTLEFLAEKEGWSSIDLRQVTLTPFP